MTASTSSLLALLQITDSSFPIGTFAHSYGLEQLVRDGIVRDATSLEAFVRSSLVMQMGQADARAVAAAARVASRGDLDELITIDHRLHVTRAPRELRDASTAAGKRLLQEVSAHPEGRSGLVTPLLAEAVAERSPGTHPVALGVVGAAFDIGAESLVGSLLFSTANALVQAAMRLLRISHRDAQAVLHRVRGEITVLSREAAIEAGLLVFASFHPLQEIAAMRHSGAPVRFFAS